MDKEAQNIELSREIYTTILDALKNNKILEKYDKLTHLEKNHNLYAVLAELLIKQAICLGITKQSFEFNIKKLLETDVYKILEEEYKNIIQ